ncbi:DUF4139 domain-containing protein [Desulfogranum mediterraneum]|uniref:DUF4139 domain-containing protein n=1 Tax=Desulfogranum mediterraneum TaxID=160661 RepID=UPI000420D4F4|nr:DUF4139 domain-containing protein [Desulfogranum mediterraneum]
MLHPLLCRVLIIVLLLPGLCPAQEVVSTAEDHQELQITIYNHDLALVRDKRSLTLGEGVNTLAFREVSSRIKPETAFLSAEGLQVLEQTFVYDLLSPQSLLQKYVGREVLLSSINPVSGAERLQPARVLSTADGVVLRTKEGIITDFKGQLRFPDLPADLRDRPTLTMLIEAEASGERTVELTYLTQGMSWQADYIAELNDQEDRLLLQGWVTLSNESGVSYHDSGLQLVAGEVNLVQKQGVHPPGPYLMKAAQGREMGVMQEESIFDYHLYTLGRRTTIGDNQQKQMSLMRAAEVVCEKHYLLKGQSSYFLSRAGRLDRTPKVGVELELKNERASGLGDPLPAGIVRVYKRDPKGSLQFVGEDRTDHVPAQEVVRLKLGEAFDLTAEKKQTDFKQLSAGEGTRRVVESEYALTLKNGKPEAVTIRVEEPVPGDWELIASSHRGAREEANLLAWNLIVPAKGRVDLSFRVRVRF